MLNKQMASFDDPEGSCLPADLPPVIDTHVHVFPQSIFKAIHNWFDEHAWQIRYRMNTSQVFEFLLSRGLQHIVALQYAHKPGIARDLNSYLAKKCKEFDKRVTGMATVFPGENHADDILQEAFDEGLGGLKLHAHVQCFDMNADIMNPLYDCCQKNNKPIVMHVGREPKSDAYQCDPYDLCSAQKLEQIVKNFPGLNICVPHLGFDETLAYKKMIEKYNNLWLDTTMVITDYFQVKDAIPMGQYRSDRIMYGSDFPNIPYEWDRELKVLSTADISHDSLERITFKNAMDFFNIKNVTGTKS